MSWSLHVVPLSGPVAAEVLELTSSASFARGVPERLPDSAPLPSARDVLVAFAAAGCHGSAWFILSDPATAALLAECPHPAACARTRPPAPAPGRLRPDPAACARTGGLDLGEVSLRAAARGDEPLSPHAPIEGMSFRKPIGAAVLSAARALTSSAGPQLVFDDSSDRLFVVWPGERAEELSAAWPG